MEMENKIRYPLTASRQTTPEGRTHIVDSDGLPHILVYRGLIGNRGRYIAACLNACMDMDLKTLESGAPGWIAEKLASCKPENPFLDALLDTTNECIKSQLASDFKAIELQNQLYAENAENERLKNTMDAANKLNDLLVKELKSVKLKLSELDAKHLETLNELEDAKEMMFDRRDEY